MKGCFVQYKTGGSEEENEQFSISQPQSQNEFSVS